jgi:hypothetical protein
MPGRFFWLRSCKKLSPMPSVIRHVQKRRMVSSRHVCVHNVNPRPPKKQPALAQVVRPMAFLPALPHAKTSALRRGGAMHIPGCAGRPQQFCLPRCSGLQLWRLRRGSGWFA